MNKTLTMLIWNRCPAKFQGTKLVILLKLAGESSREGCSHLRVDALAAACGIDVRTLQYAVMNIKKTGLLRVTCNGRGRSNCYALDLDVIRKMPRMKATEETDEGETGFTL
jgi:predicted transcriptional regulator